MLSAFGFYAIRLVMSFRTGMLAKSWKEVTTGAIFLILAQIPFLLSGLEPQAAALLMMVGTSMRLVAVVFLTIGLRAQSKVWSLEGKAAPRDSGRARQTVESR